MCYHRQGHIWGMGAIMTELHRFGRLIGLATLSAVMSLAAQVSQATPTIIQGNYEETIAQSCPNAPSCSVVFSAVPAGKALVVSDVSCQITAGGSGVITVLSLNRQGSLVNQAFLNVSAPVIVSTNFRRFFSNTEISKLYAGGAIPKVSVSFSAVQAAGNMACHIAGALITP
jgi:hypothetical protein